MKKWCEYPEKVEKFCEHIRLGMSMKSVCSGMCITQDLIWSYIRKAEKELDENPEAMSPEITFLRRYKKAEDEFETHHLQNIKNFADNGDWKASAWLLERRRQQDYVVRQDFNIGMPEKVTINMDVLPVEKNDG